MYHGNSKENSLWTELAGGRVGTPAAGTTPATRATQPELHRLCLECAIDGMIVPDNAEIGKLSAMVIGIRSRRGRGGTAEDHLRAGGRLELCAGRTLTSGVLSKGVDVCRRGVVFEVVCGA